jgi:hypothetical protein
MFHGLQDLGHVRADIDADALATLLLSLSAGLVIYDVEAEPCPADAVLAALELFVERCVVAPVSASSQRP